MSEQIGWIHRTRKKLKLLRGIESERAETCVKYRYADTKPKKANLHVYVVRVVGRKGRITGNVIHGDSGFNERRDEQTRGVERNKREKKREENLCRGTHEMLTRCPAIDSHFNTSL